MIQEMARRWAFIAPIKYRRCEFIHLPFLNIPSRRPCQASITAYARGMAQSIKDRVYFDLWYTLPAMKGGRRHSWFTVHRWPDPTHGSAGIDESHFRRVSADGSAF